MTVVLSISPSCHPFLQAWMRWVRERKEAAWCLVSLLDSATSQLWHFWEVTLADFLTVKGRSPLRGPVCCLFFPCLPFLKDSLFLISSWNAGTSRAARSSQDWGHGKEHPLGFPSVTPFSDSLQQTFTYRTIHFVATDGITLSHS